MNMLNKHGFMELGWRNDVGSLSVKDQGVSERARSDEERLVDGLKWSNGYVDHDQADIQFQIVPEIHKEEENSQKDLALVVPDEHSETGAHHHHINDFSDSSDNRCHLGNKHEKPKRRRIKIVSDYESDGFTREVPTVTRKGSKRRRDEMMSNKMRTLQKHLPNCHKTDKVSVLDKAIEYMKDLQLQLKVMSIMGLNPYIPQATLNFGMHNHMLTAMAMAMAHGINLANQTRSSPLIPASNWPLPPFSNLSFPHSSDQSVFLTTALPASSPHQSLSFLKFP